jgi:hypothetical protein
MPLNLVEIVMQLTRPAITAGLAAAALVAASTGWASPQKNLLVAFEGAINLDPSTATLGTGGVVGVTTNTVRGIAPGGRPWVLRKLSANVTRDGQLVARGKGLLLASGEFIATPGAVTAVGATLTCGAADATATRYDTIGPFTLDAAGNFAIRGPLTNDGVNTAVLPTTCSNPVLLIRSYNTTTKLLGGWFAAGIPDSGDD